MRRIAMLIVGLIVAAVGEQAVAANCDGFTDVSDASSFCADVTWIKNRAITLGCGNGTTYCPNDPVTRLQMAAFLHRMGNVTFQQGGNAFGAAGHLGTSDAQPLDIYANNQRVAHFEFATMSPNALLGHVNNGTYIGVAGASVGGGGAAGSQDQLLDTDFRTFSCIWAYGCLNGVTDSWGTIGGGAGNLAGNGVGSISDNPFATVGGGFANWANAGLSTIGGGFENRAIGIASTVAGGNLNVASGLYATVPGGSQNMASGDYAFAAGRQAKASYTGSFMWADSVQEDFRVQLNELGGTGPAWADATNTFNARATGGVFFVTGTSNGKPTWGCSTSNGSGWACASDRNLKRNLRKLDGRAVLAKLASMPVYQWQPKDGPNAQVRHFGPMAQDFRAAFGLGSDDISIGMQDADGVALAAIQGLHRLMRDKDAQLAAQSRSIETLREEMRLVRSQLAKLLSR